MAAPWDVASASSAALFRLRHLRLGLELRPEARALAGCLVLELAARRPAPRRQPRRLVLDAHPALRVASVAFRAGPARAPEGQEEEEAGPTPPPCRFVFPEASPHGCPPARPHRALSASGALEPGPPCGPRGPDISEAPCGPPSSLEPAPPCCPLGTSAPCCPPGSLEPGPPCALGTSAPNAPCCPPGSLEPAPPCFPLGTDISDAPCCPPGSFEPAPPCFPLGTDISDAPCCPPGSFEPGPPCPLGTDISDAPCCPPGSFEPGPPCPLGTDISDAPCCPPGSFEPAPPCFPLGTDISDAPCCPPGSFEPGPPCPLGTDISDAPCCPPGSFEPGPPCPLGTNISDAPCCPPRSFEPGPPCCPLDTDISDAPCGPPSSFEPGPPCCPLDTDISDAPCCPPSSFKPGPRCPPGANSSDAPCCPPSSFGPGPRFPPGTSTSDAPCCSPDSVEPGPRFPPGTSTSDAHRCPASSLEPGPRSPLGTDAACRPTSSLEPPPRFDLGANASGAPSAHCCPPGSREQAPPCPLGARLGAPLSTPSGHHAPASCPHLQGCLPPEPGTPSAPLAGCGSPDTPVSPHPATLLACSFADPPPASELPPPPVPAFSDSAASCPLVFRVDPFTDYGSSLTISLPSSLEPHQPFQVIIRYTTTDAPAIWWLDPELTYGISKPFVFTQGHSVCNRSFFPCFDTPAVKCSYSAVVKAPAGMQVLMSATQSSYKEHEGVYEFYMEYPVPAYLVALAAGDLVPADIGPRSRVWAEPCLLETAISKLSGRVEQWLSAAESLYGPYIWGRYDIVFLPPSFPIVAMENPCLTFIISSILESDEFLIIDVIHEVAHSWFGNAVTNATWEEMWLSEGLATYAQRRITTETYGAAFTCLETAFRLDALHRQMKLLGEDNPVSKLQVKLEPGVNPSNLMNLFTYEKGYCFVYYLSQLCGDAARFDAFLRAYIEKYKFTSVVAQDLLDSFLAFFPELKEQCIDSKTGLEFERWLNATGPPLAEPDLSQGSSLTSPVETLFSLWMTEPLDVATVSSCVDITKWQTFQTVLFLDRLLDGSPLPHEVISKLSECYSAQLDGMNAEIRIRWLQIIVRNDYYPDLHKVRLFLENQMSRMYTIPLYEDLCAGTLKAFALEVFYQTQSQLHPNLRKTIQQILTQGLNPLLAMDTTAAEASAPGLEDKAPEAANRAISLRDVNVSA